MIYSSGPPWTDHLVVVSIEAIANVANTGVIPREGVEVRLIGAVRRGRCREQELVAQAGIEKVIKLTPCVPHSECLRQLGEADLLLLVQVGAPLSVPGKAYEYIALGKPVLALANEGATTDLVKREKLGVCVGPEDVQGIGTALVKLYKQFASGEEFPRVLASVRDRYDGRRLTQKLDAVLRDVLGD